MIYWLLSTFIFNDDFQEKFKLKVRHLILVTHVCGQKRIENMNMFGKEQSLFKTTEITQPNPCKNAAFTTVTFGSKWICLFSEICEIIFKDAHGIGFMAFFPKTLKK